MFIDFEGIDGSGKTTLSNRLAQRLRENGLEVVHARAGGELPSELARRIRALTRDGGGAALTPESELLLNAAREAQLLAEVVRPALERGAVVIADRSLHSHLAMALARGIPGERAQAVLDLASGGTWANLVVLVDVDPEIARLRKRAGKLEEAKDEAPGRKGLSGPALLHRMRDALHLAAAAQPDRFLVVRNESQDLDRLADAIAAAVLERLGRTPARNVVRAPAARTLPPSPPAPPAPLAVEDDAALEALLLERVRSWAAADPVCAAMLLGGVPGEGAHALRRDLAEKAPAAVAASLTGVADGGIDLLERLVDAAPRSVARALALRTGAQADALRERLAATHPREVAWSLISRTDEFAWTLRERLWRVAPEAVLVSLVGDGSHRAWALRASARAVGVIAEALHASLAGLDGERAWEWRRELPVAPPALLRGIKGCIDPEAFRIRSRWLELAPRPVLKGMVGLDTDAAWELRRRAGSGAAEVLDSIAGMAGTRAQALREELAPPFPGRTLLSLPALRGEAEERLLREVVARWGGNVLVLRAAVRALAAGRDRREAA